MVPGEKAGHEARLAQAEILLGHEHRHDRPERGVGEDPRAPEREHRRQDDDDAHVPGAQGGDEDREDHGAGEVGGDDEPAPVMPVGDGPGDQPEEQGGHPLQCRGQPDEYRIAGLARDEQWTRGQRDPVPDLRGP